MVTMVLLLSQTTLVNQLGIAEVVLLQSWPVMDVVFVKR